jgi:hypothetical protein
MLLPVPPITLAAIDAVVFSNALDAVQTHRSRGKEVL